MLANVFVSIHSADNIWITVNFLMYCHMIYYIIWILAKVERRQIHMVNDSIENYIYTDLKEAAEDRATW